VEADRAFSKALLGLKVRGVPKHTVQYMLGGSVGSVTADFFEQGNAMTRYDFSKPNLYVFHFSPTATAKAISVLHDDSRCFAYDEWQMTLLKGLTSSFNIMNGYVCQGMLQPGSVVMANLCNPGDLPLSTVFNRTDLKRLCYTLESPNVRHAAQWDVHFLKNHFDVLLTYWQPLLNNPAVKTHPCLHNTHHLDLTNPLDRAAGLRTNKATSLRSVCMVLENRNNNGMYKINGQELHALDHLRSHYVKDLSDAHVFGVHWDKASLGAGVTVEHRHRNSDPCSSVDHLQKYSFAIIIENCDAPGYVSEKMYDAFSAGCVPMYYNTGNNNDLTAIMPNMYIDISRFKDSAELQDHLDNLSDEDIQLTRRRIYNQREQVLSKVSVQSHAATVAEAIKAFDLA